MNTINQADFNLKVFRGEFHLQCVYCGETLREGKIGFVKYNDEQLNYCPYCVSYAQFGLPVSVDIFQGIIHLFPYDEIKG